MTALGGAFAVVSDPGEVESIAAWQLADDGLGWSNVPGIASLQT